MTRTLRPVLHVSLLLALPPLALGCDGDGSRGPASAAGTYEITDHTQNDEGCDAEGARLDDVGSYFALEQDDFFGAPILGWHDCASPTDCDEELSLFGSFVSIDGEWRIRNSSSSGTADACTLSLTDGALEETADGIRVEIRTYRGTLTVATDEDCDPDTAEARQDELTCGSLEVIEATSL